MNDFHATIMGRKFYEGDIPRIVKALERIAYAIEKGGERINNDILEEVGMAAAFATREACAEEADKLYGEQAAAQIRAVPLPHEASDQ